MNAADLAATPARVRALLARIRDPRLRPADGEFAPLEHVCHLRDIEREGYSRRIARLLGESSPQLADLDGDRLASERNYLGQDPEAALRELEEARASSVALLDAASDADLERSGTLEHVGTITLARLVALMREHDEEHLRALAVLAALDRFGQEKATMRRELEALCRIAGISAGDPAPVRASAEATAEVLARHGIAGVLLLESDGAHPAVFGIVQVSAEAPTLLIYGHHDVQPPGRLDHWLTPPFEPVERGGRLYARGAADDKGGVMAHVAAAAAYGGAPPCNLKFFIEGEEEIGSPHLRDFLDRYGDLLRADAVVLADTPNADTGVPALTHRLRGMCMIDVEVRCLERPLHSGRGGGAAPDALAILCQLIAAVTRTPETPPPDDASLRADLGVLNGVALTGTRHDTWTRESITVIGIDAPRVDEAFNQIAPVARARLSLRTVPPLPSADAGEALVQRLLAVAMPHAHVSAGVVKSVPWWFSDGTGTLFDAALRALTRGYGAEAMRIGSGGTIGFVPTFAAAFPGTPLLLMGVEDPPCNAHAENESLHLGDWEKCVRSAIFLYDEARRVLR